MIEIYKKDDEIQQRNIDRINYYPNRFLELAEEDLKKKREEDLKHWNKIRNMTITMVTVFWVAVVAVSVYMLTTDNWIRGAIYMIIGTIWITAFLYANGDMILRKLLSTKEDKKGEGPL